MNAKIYRYARHLPSVLNKTNNIYRNALTACTYKFATWLGWTLGCLSLGKPWAPWSLATWPTCHLVTWLTCHLVTWLICHLVTCHFAYLPLGHLAYFRHSEHLGHCLWVSTLVTISLSEHLGHNITLTNKRLSLAYTKNVFLLKSCLYKECISISLD